MTLAELKKELQEVEWQASCLADSCGGEGRVVDLCEKVEEVVPEAIDLIERIKTLSEWLENND